MIFQQIKDIEAGRKQQTRRCVNEAEDCVIDPATNAITEVYTIGKDGKRRAKWRVGNVYSMVPKRAQPGVGFIRITGIGKGPLMGISEADARLEGVEDVAAYRALWGRINDAYPGKAWTDNPDVWIVSFEYVGKVKPPSRPGIEISRVKPGAPARLKLDLQRAATEAAGMATGAPLTFAEQQRLDAAAARRGRELLKGLR